MSKHVAQLSIRVRYHECDPQGIVFNANYLSYVDMASFEFCKAAFGSHAELLDRGVDMVVAETNLRYLAPSRPDDELTVGVRIDHIGNTSLVLGFDIQRDGEQVVTGTNRYVWVDTEAHRPMPLHADLRERLTALGG